MNNFCSRTFKIVKAITLKHIVSMTKKHLVAPKHLLSNYGTDEQQYAQFFKQQEYLVNGRDINS